MQKPFVSVNQCRGTVDCWQGDSVILCHPEKDGAWLFSLHLCSGTHACFFFPDQSLEF